MTIGELNVEIGARMTKLDHALDKMNSKLKGQQAQVSRTSSVLDRFGAKVVGVFSVRVLINFSKQIIRIRGEFERFQAVLSNTLGSESAAKVAMQDIQEFASKTPFAVNQLTGAFVKLANQGFRPNMQQMTKLGDLASSTGKDFDQLAEAIIDAQVGEFERLKEFGVRASKQGDNVKFTFKGVETQVKMTSEAIQGYILGLGEAEGVSGSMAKISETLEGKISNLGDTYDQLLIKLGKTSAWKNVVDGANSFLSSISKSVDVIQDGAIPAWAKFKAAIELITSQQTTTLDALAAVNKHHRDQQRIIDEGRAAEADYAKELENKNKKIAESTVELGKLTKAQESMLVQLDAIREAEKLVGFGGGIDKAFPEGKLSTDLALPGGIGMEQGDFMGIDPAKAEEARASLDRLRENAFLTQGAFNLLSQGIGGAFQSAIMGVENFQDFFASFIQDLIKQLLAAIAQAVLLQTVLSLTGLGGAGAIGGIFSSLTGLDTVNFQGYIAGDNLRISNNRASRVNGRVR